MIGISLFFLFYDQLITKKIILPSDISYSTVYRLFKREGLLCNSPRLGITLIHTKPYDAASKGKIEHFSLTVRKRFLPLLCDEDLSPLDNLNKKFSACLEKNYHRKIHSALATTPLDKYMSQINQLNVIEDPDKLKFIFLKREKRKVKHDRIISVNNELYEVPPTLISKRIEIRFDPESFEDIFFKRN